MRRDAGGMTATRKSIILKEAAHLFREKGYSGSTLRELAKRAGVQGGSIYHHFSSKQEILMVIMESTMTTLVEKVQHEIGFAKTPLEKLRKGIQFHIEYHTTDRDETYVADAELRSLEPANYKKIVVMRRKYEQIFRDILGEGIDQKCMEIENVSLAARALLQMCTGISYWYSPSGKDSIDTIVDSYVELFLYGLCGKVTGGNQK
jgi:AcrR family transcriptional regulator